MKIDDLRKTFVLIVIGCVTSFLNAQTYNDQVSDIIVHGFMDNYLNDLSEMKKKHSNEELIIDITPMRFESPDSLLKHVHDWNKYLDCMAFDLDSLLNDYDKSDIAKQLKTQKEFIWDMAHSAFSFNKIKEPTWTDLYYRLSMPIFSKSREIAIIKQTRECGYDCGELWINVYKKKENNWTLIAGWGYVI